MIRHRQFVALFLVTIIVGGLSSIIPFSVAQISKPSIPEFTVKFVNTPYDVPPAYLFNPVSGQNMTTSEGEHAEKGILLTIKHPPFTAYLDASGNQLIQLYYNVRVRVYDVQNSTNERNWTVLFNPREMPRQPNSENTTISLTFWGSDRYQSPDSRQLCASEGSQVDFQVQALEGYVHRVWSSNTTDPVWIFGTWVFVGQTSDWSSTQTITIPEALPSEFPTASPAVSILPSPTPTNTPIPTTVLTPEPTLTPTDTVPEFPAWIVVVLVVVATLTAIIAAKIKKQNIPSLHATQNSIQ